MRIGGSPGDETVWRAIDGLIYVPGGSVSVMYDKKKNHKHNKHAVQRQQQLKRQHDNQKQQQEPKQQQQQQQEHRLQQGLHFQREKSKKPDLDTHSAIMHMYRRKLVRVLSNTFSERRVKNQVWMNIRLLSTYTSVNI